MNIDFTKKHTYFYPLPDELIAQTPSEKRDESRLLVLDKHTGEVSHRHFYDVVDYFRPGDCLVLNETRVIPARLFGRDEKGREIETVLLKRTSREGEAWECLTRPGKRTRVGNEIVYSEDMTGVVLGTLEGGTREIEFRHKGVFVEILERIGLMPLPPYITEKLSENERYQTVYSRQRGSAAAPTAGLHFTGELLRTLESRGVEIAKVLLHVGLGTFRPVKEEDITNHKMHSEHIEITADAAERINKCRRDGGRVIAVGTTSARLLESVTDERGETKAYSGETGIFIYPGYKFKGLDGMITNFHLPESTLIMLVCAFAGYESTMAAYRTAVQEKYRFFSFGDAMLII